MGLLDGKKAVIFGVANERSIAWAISEALHAEGAEVLLVEPGQQEELELQAMFDDSDDDAILITAALRRGGYAIASERVVDSSVLARAQAASPDSACVLSSA